MATVEVGKKRRYEDSGVDPDDYDTDEEDIERLHRRSEKYADMRHRDLKSYLLNKKGRKSVWKRRSGGTKRLKTDSDSEGDLSKEAQQKMKKKKRRSKREIKDAMDREISKDARDLLNYTQEFLNPEVVVVKEEETAVVKDLAHEKKCKKICAEKFFFWPSIEDPDDSKTWSWAQELKLRKRSDINGSLHNAIVKEGIHERRRQLRDCIKKMGKKKLLEADNIVDEACGTWFRSVVAQTSVPVALRIVETLCACKSFFLPGNVNLLDSLIKETQCGHYFISVDVGSGASFTIHHQYVCSSTGKSLVGVQRFYFNAMDGKKVVSQQTRSRTLPGLDWSNPKNTRSLSAVIQHMRDMNYVATPLIFPKLIDT